MMDACFIRPDLPSSRGLMSNQVLRSVFFPFPPFFFIFAQGDGWFLRYQVVGLLSGIVSFLSNVLLSRCGPNFPGPLLPFVLTHASHAGVCALMWPSVSFPPLIMFLRTGWWALFFLLSFFLSNPAPGTMAFGLASSLMISRLSGLRKI